MASNRLLLLSKDDVLWTSPHQTLPRKCMLDISGPPSLVKVFADFWNMLVMTCYGESTMTLS